MPDVGSAAFHSELLDSVGQPVVAFDAQLRVLYANRCALRACGRSKAEVIGASLHDLGVIDTARARRAVTEAAAGTPWSGELSIRVVGGRRRPVLVALTPIAGEDGATTAVIGVGTDLASTKESAAAERRLRAILGSSSLAVATVSMTGVLASWNSGAERLLGYPAAGAVGRHCSLVAGGDAAELVDAVRDGVAVDDNQMVWRHRDGHPVHVLVATHPLLDGSGNPIGAAVIVRDVSDRVAAESRQAQAEERFVAAFRRSSFGMYIADLEGRPTAVNPAICQMLGMEADALVGHRLTDHGHPDDPATSGYDADERADSWTDERRYVRSDGLVVWLQEHVTLAVGGDGEPAYYMAQIDDVTERHRVEDLLVHRTLHDDLTGLASRTLLTDRLEHALAVSQWGGTSTGVVFLDIDGFTHVNDALGHRMGDQLLVEVARRVEAIAGPIDTVARFGGDEFVVACPDTGAEAMATLARDIAEAVALPYRLGERDVVLRASLGITLSRDGSTSHSLLSEADAAMYRAKELGRDRAVVFDDSLLVRAAARIDGERALRAGIEAGEMVAYYQPIIDLGSGTVTAMEALVRWRHSDGRVVAPADFIPLAEQTGLIVDIGGAVMEQAVREAMAWNATSPHPVAVNVNLSARQLGDARLLERVADVLVRTGLPAPLLHLEITETVVMEDLARSVPVLEGLRHLGVKLAIDDFGTGYSSLAYLKQLPVDTLKIDRSFVRDLTAGSSDTSIVAAIVALGRALGLRCLAEGVETAEQRSLLLDLGCELGQGYLWSRPVPAVETVGLLAPFEISGPVGPSPR